MHTHPVEELQALLPFGAGLGQGLLMGAAHIGLCQRCVVMAAYGSLTWWLFQNACTDDPPDEALAWVQRFFELAAEQAEQRGYRVTFEVERRP